MKDIFCNIKKPSLIKIAEVTENHITNISRKKGVYFCKLNGIKMKASNARKKMLDNVHLYTYGGNPCKV